MDIVTLAASRKYTDKKIMESGAVGIKYEIVDSLPSSGEAQTIYFIKNNNSLINDYYDEYVWISSSSAFEKIGSTQIDGSTTQPDWSQNDATQPDYIKNRPFYTGDPVETVLVEERTLAFEFEKNNHGLYIGGFQSTFSPIVGETYKVYWDGTVYECSCVDFNNILVIGNLSIMGVGSDTGEPFLLAQEIPGAFNIGTTDTSASHTISITGITMPVVKINPKYLDKPDWDQNDVTASSYIKNRPFYTGYTEEKTLIEECTVMFGENTGKYLGSLSSTFLPIVGETYKVSWDGTVYESTCTAFGGPLIIGNPSIIGAGSDTGEPFIMRIGSTIKIYTLDTATSHTISISGRTTQIVKINEEYLPDTVATKSDVETAQTAATNAQSTANNAQTAANNAQTAANNAVKYTASQNLTDAQKQQARTNIGAGTSSFSGNYNDLVNKPTIVQGDWNVNNDTDMAYIKNRTHYDYTKYTRVSLSENRNPTASSLINNTYYYGEKTGGSLNITSGNIYKVSCSNSTTYISTCQSVPIPGQALGNAGRVLGNAQLGVNAGYLNGTSPDYPITDTGEPWCFISYQHTSKNAIISTISNFNISELYIQSAHELKQLDEKYIPSTIAKTSDIPTDVHINELINTALSAIGVAEEGTY